MMKALIDLVKNTLTKAEVDQIASNKTFSVKDLIDLSFHFDAQIGFRAAWILERVYSLHEERFLPFTRYFLTQLPLQRNFSALRHYVKILAFMTDKKASGVIKNVIETYETDTLVEVVFAWLIDDKIPVAVKSHCLNILANLIQKHNWVQNELIETMEFLVDKESVAFFAKVKQIRKQLRRFSIK